MVTVPAPRHGAWRAPAPETHAEHGGHVRGALQHALYVARGVLGALFAAELVLPEAEPAQVRSLLVELGHLDAAAPEEEQRAALVSFQLAHGLPSHGAADGRTVSTLVKATREFWELRDLGLAPTR
ncbi:hypothetical protein [Allosalinactinospora lopnorensis]|uniref:hypothetical protein n=1 Tax=Allosalinactinospora lopnorensis TaxID=1352348 RepID=UPI000623D6DE|nr:hypothetical protein [Allosalinactinospora lopnorensis]